MKLLCSKLRVGMEVTFLQPAMVCLMGFMPILELNILQSPAMIAIGNTLKNLILKYCIIQDAKTFSGELMVNFILKRCFPILLYLKSLVLMSVRSNTYRNIRGQS